MGKNIPDGEIHSILGNISPLGSESENLTDLVNAEFGVLTNEVKQLSCPDTYWPAIEDALNKARKNIIGRIEGEHILKQISKLASAYLGCDTVSTITWYEKENKRFMRLHFIEEGIGGKEENKMLTFRYKDLELGGVGIANSVITRYLNEETEESIIDDAIVENALKNKKHDTKTRGEFGLKFKSEMCIPLYNPEDGQFLGIIQCFYSDKQERGFLEQVYHTKGKKLANVVAGLVSKYNMNRPYQ